MKILTILIESKETRRRMGENSRALYERNFGLNAMFGRVLSLYRDSCSYLAPEVRTLLTQEMTR